MRRRVLLVLLSLLSTGAVLGARPERTTAADLPTAEIVRIGESGHLVYQADAKGNVIPDFSYAGYMGGGVALPDVPVKITLDPSLEEDENDSPRIQAALQELAATPPDENGFRGALLLRGGRYLIDEPLIIPASGIVVRGEGKHNDGSATVLRGVGEKFSEILVVRGDPAGVTDELKPQAITQDYLPAGSRSFMVANADAFKPGDSVLVVRAANRHWLETTGGSRVGWTAEGYTYRYRRRITAVDGDQVSIDAPVVAPIEKQYGGGRLAKYSAPGLLRNVGIENLRVTNAGQSVVIDEAEDVWVRDVITVSNIYSCVSVRYHADRVTVQDCSFIDPTGPIKGGYRYAFNLAGHNTLVQRCYARNGRHDFVLHNQAKGPNVFLDCFAEEAHTDSGPHHRWAVGALFDNVKTDHGMTAKDAGNRGTGHGWTGAQMVFWNCWPRWLNIQDPPTDAQNYIIGCKGARSERHTAGNPGYTESPGSRVAPRSLYLAQLRDRQGDEGVRAVTIPEQREGSVRMMLRRDLAE
jgi:hypothetical protein